MPVGIDNAGTRPPYGTGDAALDAKIKAFLAETGIPDCREYYEMVVSVYRLHQQATTPADRRLFNQSLKELRYASKIFSQYKDRRKITVFGSARTPSRAREWRAARDFGEIMARSGYMVITGGGDGIMGAAQEGAGRDHGFGLNIALPFEQKANATIFGDAKLINFHYFFTRKLNFVKESHAIALFPGGFGTMDEGFEAITLMQTGKAVLRPVVFIDAPGGNFWKTFEKYLREHLLRDGLVSESDFHLFKFTDDLQAARREIETFYYNFHSYRGIGNQMVIRLRREVPEGALKRLRDDFADILGAEDDLRSCAAFPEEKSDPEVASLPRLCLTFDRKAWGRFRQLIDRLNEF
ncbi:MAG TPA: TIGR00730 family Rossman fold protein [Candidatus Methylacidiphilales bacterium]